MNFVTQETNKCCDRKLSGILFVVVIYSKMSNLCFLIFLSGLVYTSCQTLDPTTSTIATTTQSNLESKY
jgi:hypothetical protein